MSTNLPTSGAVAVRNEKGEWVTQKVKVKRYLPGKRPDYAPEESDSDVVWWCIPYGGISRLILLAGQAVFDS